VVDTKNAKAQEILRGVAQAQDQFNKSFKGRLLEIVIANDSNNPEQAKQVAQEIVKDLSILGVIGHNSNDTNQAAIPEYEKVGLAVISPSETGILPKKPVFFKAKNSYNATQALMKDLSVNSSRKTVLAKLQNMRF
jgi:branched-chain amino acid transport system substrate-binding protein